jgi:hypothetical protein
MNISYASRCALVALASLLSFQQESRGSSSSDEYPPLPVHGVNYPNACNQGEKTRLQAALIDAKLQDEPQLWRAIETLLCASSNATNRSYVKSLIPPKIRKVEDSEEDKPVIRMVTVSEELITDLMAGGNAWLANIHLGSGKVSFDYFSNEACVKEVTLEFTQSRWYVRQISAACD